MSIKHWPESERPREKLLARGAGSLSDAELLAVFLRTGVSGRSAVALARDMLMGFDGLRGLLDAPAHELLQQAGLGPAKFAQLQAALELARRHLAESLNKGDAVTDPHLARRYLQSQLRHLAHEVFACLFLDNRHRMIRYTELFQGTINGASVYPREVVKAALACNAAAVIACHNHPSGVAEPSQADIQITQQLAKALDLVEIRLLDHLIIGDGAPVSLAERGLI